MQAGHFACHSNKIFHSFIYSYAITETTTIPCMRLGRVTGGGGEYWGVVVFLSHICNQLID